MQPSRITPMFRLRAAVGPYGLTWIRVGVPRWSRASLGASVVAASAVLVLLLAMGQVARHAVDQGEQRRLATALYWQATWKCQALRERTLRRDCLERLQAIPPAAAAQPAHVGYRTYEPDRAVISFASSSSRPHP